MKIIISEQERGFLFKNGVYKKLLAPGKHYIMNVFGETYERVSVTQPIAVSKHGATSAADISVLLRDDAFAQNVTRIDVPDGHIAIHMEDKRIIDALQPGT